MGNMFGGSKPAAPTPPPPVPMVDEAAIQAAKKKAITRQRGSSGRDSTILGGADGTSDKLGG